MDPDDVALTASYLEHLTDDDLALLCRSDLGSASRGDYRRWVGARRGGIKGLLGRREVFDAIFVHDRGAFIGASPFLAFGVAVHRAAQDLSLTAYVPEWVGVGRRTPLFDVPRLREFASSPWRCFFLAELLASYSRVASGSVLVATRRGLRRQRFSELDPVRLAGLLDLVSDAERPGVLRRLGDLALFLTGVFPDYIARHGFGPVDQGRLLRAGRTTLGGDVVSRKGATGPVMAGSIMDGDVNAVALLCQLGRRWYQAASRLLPGPVPANVAVISEMPERFDDARRLLSVVAERFLFPNQDLWFGVQPA